MTCKNTEKKYRHLWLRVWVLHLILDFPGSKTDKHISLVHKPPNLSFITTLRCITTPPQNKNGKQQPKEPYRKKIWYPKDLKLSPGEFYNWLTIQGESLHSELSVIHGCDYMQGIEVYISSYCPKLLNIY